MDNLELRPPLKKHNALETAFMKHLVNEVWVEQVLVGDQDAVNRLFVQAQESPELIRDVQVLAALSPDGCILARYKKCLGITHRGDE